MVPIFLAGCPRLPPAYARACAAAAAVPPGDEAAAHAFLDAAFRPVSRGTDTVTGYFEITVAGRRVPGGEFVIPVLRAPRDPRRFSRGEIVAGALAGRDLEFLYLRSLADLFFLQLQGSGRVRLADGQEVRIGTQATNGRPQIDTAVLFGDAGIPGRDLSIPGIRAWLAGHPAEQARLLRDPSYVFFRETPGLSPAYGPLGASGLPLVPGHSVAVDPNVTPLGSLLWLDATGSASHRPLAHLVVAHDIGPQINGPARLDLFFGAGEAAEQQGGRQFGPGRVWALVPR
jgi:membrane-bound lytic murein transglycosylase A